VAQNKYIKNSRILERSFREILRYFSEYFDATQTSRLTGMVEKQSIFFSTKYGSESTIFVVRNRYSQEKLKLTKVTSGQKRIRGKRGRGAKGKIPVFGLLKRNDKVFTQVIPNCSRKELTPIIHGKVLEGSTVYTEGWKSYDGLVLNGYKHYRIHHHENEFARGNNHVNGIESFWSFTKRRMRKFNGIRKDQFLLHLKESEFCWNNRGGIIYKVLISEFRKRPL